MVINIFVIGLGMLILAAAVTAVYLRNIVASIIAAGVVSLLSSIIYLILAAPDVAMTEAAIGSGLTTLVFLFAISKLKKEDLND